MWRLAWRNLWRNRTRTAITGSAIALGLTMQLFSMGTADSMYIKMNTAAERAAGGNILVHGTGYWDSRQVDKLVDSAAATVDVIGGVDGVTRVIPRVIVTGLLSTARGNAGASITGMVPDAEKALDDKTRFITEGTFLDGDERAPIVLGRAIVDDLKIELGERVVVTATDPSGEITRLAFELVGIVETGSDLMDKGAAWTTLSALADQLGLTDQITQIGVMVEDGDRRATVRDAIVAALGDRAPSLEVMTWDEAMPEMVQFVEIDKQWSAIMGTFIFIVVAFGIANTFLMAVLERVRELGLLSALGLSPRRVAALVVAESVLLAFVSIGIGLGLGLLAHSLTAHYGIDFAAMSGGAELDMNGVVMEDMIIYSVIDPARWVAACVAVMVLIVLSALYPAWRATRTEPATAMRTYE